MEIKVLVLAVPGDLALTTLVLAILTVGDSTTSAGVDTVASAGLTISAGAVSITLVGVDMEVLVIDGVMVVSTTSVGVAASITLDMVDFTDITVIDTIVTT